MKHIADNKMALLIEPTRDREESDVRAKKV